MRAIGLHLRITGSLSDCIQKALRLKLSCFQCFLVSKETGEILHFDESDIKKFLQLRRKHFNDLYIHGSYLINLSSIYRTRHPFLHKELILAKRLEFTHLVLHPGTAQGAVHKDEGIDALARTLNRLLKDEHDIQIVLENTVYGGLSIGGDLHDFKLLLNKLDYPERVTFCIDTAHAHSFGYDIVSNNGQKSFINIVQKSIGFDAITLIHLNDSAEQLGLHIDLHAPIGEGAIGEKALKKFIVHPSLKNIPLILEPPVISEQEEEQLLQKVRSWIAQ